MTTHSLDVLTGRRLTTPRAAAIAGILFAILFSTSLVLLRLSLPTSSIDSVAWQEFVASRVNLALGLMPFSGIAFLWFMGVVRDRLGAFEDQFFSTIFFGSELLFLAMIFAASAIAGGIAASYAANLAEFVGNEVYRFARATMSQFFTIYALRMAGVFVISLGTIWLCTGLMPRWLSFVTYLFALILLLSTTLSLWMVLVFPSWVLIISVYILVINLRKRAAGAADGMTPHLAAKD
jgi:hypothetical protein